MKKLTTLILTVALCSVTILTGCQTRVTATKNPETVTILSDGKPLVTSGGWAFTARSPLYASEALKGFSAEIGTNGYVRVGLDAYERDFSTNAVTHTTAMFSGGAQLVTAIGDAYVKIAGGGAQASTVLSMANAIYEKFTSSGGDASKATVTTDATAGTLTITDGTTTVTSDASGNLTTTSSDTTATPAT